MLESLTYLLTVFVFWILLLKANERLTLKENNLGVALAFSNLKRYRFLYLISLDGQLRTTAFYISSCETLNETLKGQSHQDLVLLENPMKVLVLIGNPLTVV